MAKLGAKQLAARKEYSGGKVVQQLGVKPTQAAVKRKKDIEAERQAIINENKRIEAANKLAKEKYEAEKARVDAINARKTWFYGQINKMYKAGDWSYSKPKGLTSAEDKIWENASSNLASAGVFAEKYGGYPTGGGEYQPFPTGPVKYKVGEELVSSYKTSDIPQTKIQPQLVSAQESKYKQTIPPEMYEDIYQKAQAGEPGFSELLPNIAVEQYITKPYKTYIPSEMYEDIYQKAQAGDATAKELLPTIAAEKPLTFTQKVWKKAEPYYFKLNEPLKKYITTPIFGVSEKIGFDITTPRVQRLGQPSWLGIGPLGIRPPVKQDFTAGFTSGILEDVKRQPGKQVILFGAGVGLGFAVSGTITGVSAASPTMAGILKGTTTLGGIGLGGYYVYDVSKKTYVAGKTGGATEAGKVLGVKTKDIFLVGKGFQTGEKGFEQLRGLVATRQRTFIETKQGEFPSAPPKKQLKLFRENIHPELGEKAGAFHTSGYKFWDKTVVPKAGFKELPGTYASTHVSTPFARIPGGAYVKLKVGTFFKDIFQPVGKPGVAYLQPKGFRYSPVGKTKPYYIEGQKFIYGFKKPVKPGWADVPGLKGEIESLFRVGSGEYGLVSKGYYTLIKGVRVPVDSFAYAAGTGKIGTSNLVFEPGSYNVPPPSSAVIIAPSFIGLSSSRLTTSKSYVAPSSSKVSSYIPPSSSIKTPSSAPSSGSYASSFPSSVGPSYPPSLPPSYPPSTPPSYPPSYPPSTPPSYPPIKPPKLPPYFGRIKLKKRRTKPKPFKAPGAFSIKRSPSLWAAGEKIYAKKPFSKFETSGLTLRPIIIDEKKKKRRWNIFRRTKGRWIK